jgi:uncharacterized protein (TIGR03086 family)
MSEIAARYRRVADDFTARVNAVPEAAWDNPAPCEGWRARHVVLHLSEWVPALFFTTWEMDAPPPPSAYEDPSGAWTATDAAIRSALDDPDIATSPRPTPMGTMTFEQLLDAICTPDVLVHTWDLARATGLDETLDPAEVSRLLASMEPMDEPMRASGHFGPKVDVPDDADDQTRLIAFTGRHP